jgi:hypothetical protein
MTYTILKAMPIKGHDGQGFQATLGFNGKPIADVFDSGHGGCLEVRWKDLKAGRVEVSAVQPHDGKTYTWKCTPAEAALEAHVATLPPVASGFADCAPLVQTVDLFVGLLVDEFLETRRAMRMLAKSTVVLVGGKHVYKLTGRGPLSATITAQLSKKHPGSKLVVLNDLPVPKAIEAYLAAGR